MAWMCRQLAVPRCSYYRWKEATDTPTTIRHRELTDQVKTVFKSSDGIFGHRMVHAKLHTAGVDISVGTVASIMAENGWAVRRMRAFKRTTIPSDPEKVFKGLIGRDFTADTPGTRMIVGWVMADHMRASCECFHNSTGDSGSADLSERADPGPAAVSWLSVYFPFLS